MESTKDNNIEQLQMLDQNIQNVLMQKQTFQSQLIELDTALEELEKSKGKNYRIIGPIMVSAEKEDLKKEISGKKEILNLRIKTIEKQENDLKEKASKLQSEVLKQIKSKDGKTN